MAFYPAAASTILADRPGVGQHAHQRDGRIKDGDPGIDSLSEELLFAVAEAPPCFQCYRTGVPITAKYPATQGNQFQKVVEQCCPCRGMQ